MNKEVTKCKNCDRLLIKRLNSKEYEVITIDHRKNILYIPGNTLEITCGYCNQIAKFTTKKKELGLSYVIALAKK